MRHISIYVFLFVFCGLFIGTSQVQAQSEVKFPKGWEKWSKPSTPLTGIGALPGCDADVSKLPAIYRETVSTYCGVKAGGPGKVEILVKPKALKTFRSRNGKFTDGANMVLHLIDLKVLFVSGHKKGKPVYGVFLEDGKDIAAKEGPLALSTCTTCHTGYKSFCVNGQCGRSTK